MAEHNADHLISGTDIAPGARTNLMNFSALRFAENRVAGFDESARETFAASASTMILTKVTWRWGHDFLWPSTSC